MNSNADYIQIRPLKEIPEIKPGDDLCAEILKSLRSGCAGPAQSSPPVTPGSIFVVAQKVVSKSEGRIVALDTVSPSPKAVEWARAYNKDPRLIETVLSESKRLVKMERGVLIAETFHGFICANAGVDASNAPTGCVILLPKDPDVSARRLRRQLEQALERQVGVIISDTFGRPWRRGLTNVALGVAGLSPFIDYRGRVDSSGRTLQATMLAVADELAAAAELVMGKTSAIPAAVIEGYRYVQAEGSASQLIRAEIEDLFR